MVTYWQQIDGQFTKVKKDKLDSEKEVWIDARSITRDETTELQAEYEIEQDHILDILDPDELSRIEDGEGYVLMIIRVPVFDPSAEVPYFTIPVGIIIKNKVIITICWTDSEVIKDFGANRVKNVRLNDFPSFIVSIMNRGDTNFLRYLKEINRRSTGIQSEMKLEIENKEIIQLLALEKSLVLFNTSLKSNQLLLEKLSRTKLLKLDEDDLDLIDDVKIDNRQAIEMADTYSSILWGVMDAYSSVISNNMNVVMKKLSVISLVMMVPTFITSFFGMNFPLPFESFGRYATAVVSAICLLSIVVAAWAFNINKTGMETEKKSIKTRRASRKQKRALRKETKALKRQEKKIK